MKKTPIIIVAAGASRRMKETKQLLPLGTTTLLGHAIKQAKAANCGEVITVLGSHYDMVLPEIAHFDTTIIKNSNWGNGIGSSIAAGVNFMLQKNEDFCAVLIMLADQPLIDANYLKLLIAASCKDPGKIIATKYPRSNGVPAVFPEVYFKGLSLLEEDVGAKYLLNGIKPVIALDAGNKIMDIDTPEDYNKIQTILKTDSHET